MSRPTQLYRAYDHTGTLLYVGISLNALNRMSQHRRGASPWFPSIARLEMQAFASREEAEAAERTAISDERPKYNISHNYNPRLPDNSDSPAAVSLDETISPAAVMTAAEFRARLRGMKLRQIWFAAKLGVNPVTVNRWATGTVPVAPYVLFILDMLERVDISKLNAALKPEDRAGMP